MRNVRVIRILVGVALVLGTSARAWAAVGSAPVIFAASRGGHVKAVSAAEGS